MGFWERLFSSSPVNNASGNNVAFPGVRSSKEAVNEPDVPDDHDADEKTEFSEDLDVSEDYIRTDAFDFSEDHHGMTEEYASETYSEAGRHDGNSYSGSGVFFKEASDIYRLTYDGILAKDGAQDVYAVVGTDDNGAWKDIMYYPMQKTDGQVFEVLLPFGGRGNVNVAFKDGAGHWDNNSGRNYLYVSEGG